jgi:hypothetical protein
MTWFGIANSGELLSSTNETNLFKFSTLLGDVNGGVAATTVIALRNFALPTGTPASGQIMKFDGSAWTYDADAGGNHNLLSATHSDTLASAVTRGSVIVGNATPAWAELALGTAEFVLFSDGTDAIYTRLGAVTPFSLGTAGAPSHTFTGDLDTGWSAAAADTLIGSASGLALLTIDGTTQTLDFDAGQTVRTRSVGATTTALIRDYVILATAAPITVNLPPSPVEGRILQIKDRDGNAGGGSPVTIAGNGNNIDGETEIEITNNYGSFSLLFSGTEWNVI